MNWCPKLGTVLANDEVIDGRSERGGYPVLRKPLKQWTFRITSYAQRLLDGLKHVEWPESTKTMQAEWIGRSEGAEVDFKLDTLSGETLRVFTRWRFHANPRRLSQQGRVFAPLFFRVAGPFRPVLVVQQRRHGAPVILNSAPAKWSSPATAFSVCAL